MYLNINQQQQHMVPQTSYKARSSSAIIILSIIIHYRVPLSSQITEPKRLIMIHFKAVLTFFASAAVDNNDYNGE
jgi:hypothetical protein